MPGGDELSESSRGDTTPRPETEEATVADSSVTNDDVSVDESGVDARADDVDDGSEPEWFASAGESPYLEASAFKDSGSFFRDKVARSLAEEYGIDLDDAGDQAADSAASSGADGQQAQDADTHAGTASPAEDTDQAAAAAAGAEEDEEATEQLRPADAVGGDSGGLDEATVQITPTDAADASAVDEEGTTERLSPPSSSGPGADDEATEQINLPSSAAADDEETTERLSPSAARAGDDEATERLDVPASSATVDAEETTEQLRPADAAGGDSGGLDEATVQIAPVGAVDAEETTERLSPSAARAGDDEATERLDVPASSAAVDAEETTERISPVTPTGHGSGEETTVQLSPVEAAQSQAAPSTTDPSESTKLETTAVLRENLKSRLRKRPLRPRFRKSAAAAGGVGPASPPPPTAPSGTSHSSGPAEKKAPAKKTKRKKPLWWRITRAGLIVIVLLVGLVTGAFAYAYSMFEVPDAAQADATAQGSIFYYADGSVLTERGVNRKPVSLDEVPEHVQNAILSAENRGFWDEPGVSITGTARAVWSTVTGKQLQGGSTITQQFVRNYYEGLSQEQTIERKLKEIIIALKVDRSQSKEWILEQYLNTIYFGRNAYGIQAAAEAYYDKDVGDLTPDEAAFLAAAIQQPTKFGFADSDTTPEMESRWQYVVNGLVDMGSITEAEAAEYKFPKPLPERPQDNIDLSGYKGYMFQQAMKELEELGYTEDNINRGGYEIHTTFDPKLMELAYEAVQETVPIDDLPEGVRVGLSVVDPKTGGVLAFYGGEDYFENQYDSAFLGTAQAGSAMKPYVLAAALKEGLSLHTVVDGRGPRYINGTRIQNAGNAPGGPMNLIQATAVSNNLGYIDLAQRVGLEKVAETAYAMGLPEGSIDLVPVLPLGANSVSPTDQAGGYATFANGGEHIETHVVASIINKEGEEERPEPKRNRVLTKEQAADATYAMRQVITSGTGTAANIGRPAAGKTGTTDGSVAAWFVGYTPQLSAAVGIYSGDNQRFYVPGWGTLSGGTLPATVWRTFMQKALADKPVEDFPSPSFGGSAQNWAPQPEPSTPADTPQDQGPNQDGLNPAPEPEVPQPAPEPVVPEPVVPEPVVPEPVVPEPGGPDPGFPGGGLPPSG
ncbi:hypothetical protein JCM3263A_04550 [Thermobifida fusca]|uniref:transglycosylase domain-containing protein n=1 Tax=Thermobifida fusca TaxID=2021 RepID=UPI00077CCA94|nr:transglycosylase domain-containing protein [Thermobifida fusca]